MATAVTAARADALVCSVPKTITTCGALTEAHRTVKDSAAAWMELIEQATATIEIDMSYFSSPDPARSPKTNALLEALARKANAGVKVRVFLDGDLAQVPGYDDTQRFPVGDNISIVRPPRSTGDWRVNHKKMIVVDGDKPSRRAYVGSANIDANLIDGNVGDCGLLVEGKAAEQAAAIVRQYWTKYQYNGLADKLGVVAKRYLPVVPRETRKLIEQSPVVCSHYGAITPPDSDMLATGDALVVMIGNAKSKIDIQMYNMYSDFFSYGTSRVHPDMMYVQEIYKALDDRCANGVTVRFLLDSTPFGDATAEPFKGAVGRKRFADDIRARLPRCAARASFKVELVPGNNTTDRLGYDPQIHSKYVIVDDTYAWVGSENWEESYFNRGANCGVVTANLMIVAKLGSIFDAYNSCGIAKALDFKPSTAEPYTAAKPTWLMP